MGQPCGFIHTHTVIFDCNGYHIQIPPDTYAQTAAFGRLFKNAVYDGVFYQGLEDYFDDQAFPGRFVYLPPGLYPVFKTHILDVHIELCMLYLRR